MDVVIPSLATSEQGGGETNSQLNASTGMNYTIQVQLFSTLQLNVTMSFAAYYTGANTAGSADVGATFEPRSLTLRSTGGTTVLLTVIVPPNAAIGAYNAVVTAVDASDPSQVWGTFFEISVR